jgi:hypothetical protein
MPTRIGQRPLDDAERKALKRLLPPLVRNLLGTLFRYLLLVVLVFLALTVTGLMLETLIRDIWHGPALELPWWVGVVLVIAIYGTTLFAPLPRMLRSHRRRILRDCALRDDALGGVAEVIEIHATNAALTWLAHQPVICLDLSADQRLVLHGDRLHWDVELFGLSTKDASEDDDDHGTDDPDDDAWSDRTSFPNSHCVIHRLPHSGRLLRIDLRGTPIEPLLIDSPDIILAEAMKTLVENPGMESMLIPGIAPQPNPS